MWKAGKRAARNEQKKGRWGGKERYKRSKEGGREMQDQTGWVRKVSTM